MAMMKSSNTEWLGDIPAEWDVAQIGNYYELRNEKVSDYDFEPLSVTMKGIVPQLATAAKSDDHSNRKLVKKGDSVINSRSDRRGSCGISPLDGSVSLINTVMEPRGEMNPQYYNWLFHTEQFADEFYKWGHGIVDDLWTTRWQEMKKILIVAPSPDEQQAIADYLDETCSQIDEIIAEAKASIDEYKELRQGVIFEAVTKGLDKNVEMKSTSVGWIGTVPLHWRVAKIRQVAEFYNGDRSSKYPSGDDIVSEGIIFITSNNLGYIVLNTNISTNKFITKQKYDDLGGAKLRINDIVFCLRGSVGKCAINKTFDEGTIASSLVVIRAKKVDADYLNYVLQNHRITDEAIVNAIGIGSLNLAAHDISEFYMPIPPEKEMQDIVRYLDDKVGNVDDLISEKESLINDLEAYKKSLIYEVVTGKRRVV